MSYTMCKYCGYGVNKDENAEHESECGIDHGVCPECEGTLESESINNGFSEPDPTHIEIRTFCKDCGYEV